MQLLQLSGPGKNLANITETESYRRGGRVKANTVHAPTLLGNGRIIPVVEPWSPHRGGACFAVLAYISLVDGSYVYIYTTAQAREWCHQEQGLIVKEKKSIPTATIPRRGKVKVCTRYHAYVLQGRHDRAVRPKTAQHITQITTFTNWPGFDKMVDGRK